MEFYKKFFCVIATFKSTYLQAGDLPHAMSGWLVDVMQAIRLASKDSMQLTKPNILEL